MSRGCKLKCKTIICIIWKIEVWNNNKKVGIISYYTTDDILPKQSYSEILCTSVHNYYIIENIVEWMLAE